MARKQNHEGPRIFWRNGRAYADFRGYADVGGERGALCEPGSSWGTTDPQVAEELFAIRLGELRERRRRRLGVPQQRSTTLDVLIRDHLKMRHEAGNTSHSHMMDLEQRLGSAIAYFGMNVDPPALGRRRHTAITIASSTSPLASNAFLARPGSDVWLAGGCSPACI